MNHSNSMDRTENTNLTMSQDQIYEVIFSLLRTALWGNATFPFIPPSNVDWEVVNKEMSIQTVNLLPIDLLAKLDKAHKTQYFQATTAKLRSWYNLMSEQQKLYALFQKEQIPFAILKGSAANYYYPQPTYRRMGDIDLIVKPDVFERAVQVLNENNYLPTEDTEGDHYRHLEYKKNGVLFELHRFFSVLNEDEAAAWLDATIYDGIEECKEAFIEGFSFPMLPTLANGLVLLSHINQHLEHGLGLRQIIDWMLFVDRELSDEYWEKEFRSSAQKIGMEKLAITVTHMCQMYLGLNPNLTWCKDADASLCKELMEYIIMQGNFGKKLGKESNVAINTFNLKDMKTLFGTLQNYGLNNWELAKKYSILRPFAWIYQLCRYITKGLQRETPFKQLKEDYLKSKSHNSLMDKLEVTRRKKQISTPKGKQF